MKLQNDYKGPGATSLDIPDNKKISPSKRGKKSSYDEDDDKSDTNAENETE